jgi:hypothetical protein
VAPGANGKAEPVIAGEVHAGDDVSHLPGAQHRQRVLVKHAIVNRARLVVSLVASGNDVTPDALAKGLDTHPDGRPLDGCVSHRHSPAPCRYSGGDRRSAIPLLVPIGADCGAQRHTASRHNEPVPESKPRPGGLTPLRRCRQLCVQLD